MGWSGWAVAGFFGGGVAVFAVGMALPSVIRISQAEGAYAMGVAFFWTPLGAILGAVIAGYLGSGRSWPVKRFMPLLRSVSNRKCRNAGV